MSVVLDIWRKIGGGASSSGKTADRDGDLFERNEFLIDQLVDNAGGGGYSFDAWHNFPASEMLPDGWAVYPGLIARVAGGNSAVIGPGSLVGAGTFVWNATEKVWSVDSRNGTTHYLRLTPANLEANGYGWGGTFPATNFGGEGILSYPPTTRTIFVFELYGAMGPLTPRTMTTGASASRSERSAARRSAPDRIISRACTARPLPDGRWSPPTALAARPNKAKRQTRPTVTSTGSGSNGTSTRTRSASTWTARSRSPRRRTCRTSPTSDR